MSRVMPAPTTQPQPQTGGGKSAPTHEQIATRAYEKWLKKGRPSGNTQIQDWLEAEAELKNELARRR